MLEFIADYGYISMFIMGFLAATIIPLGSEWLLIMLLIKGLDPYMIVLTATMGNYLGACTTYAVGYYGSDFLTNRVFKIDSKNRVKAERIYNKYGAVSLIMSWVPIIGDPLCFVAGLFKYSIYRFSILVSIGKLGRYAFLTYITLKSAEILTK